MGDIYVDHGLTATESQQECAGVIVDFSLIFKLYAYNSSSIFAPGASPPFS